MRNLAIMAAVSALAIASPAAARDGSYYVGIDAGFLMPNDGEFEYDDFEVVSIDQKNGYDLDLVAGHDFGFVRAEGELSWKYAKHDEFNSSEGSADADGDTDVRSIMLNVLGDVGNDQWAFYAGGGIGFARVDYNFQDGSDSESFKDSGFAWQGIAGVRFAVNEMIDIGLKYRYFDTSQMEDNDLDFDFTSHSIMFSFIYNLYREPPRAPLPPPPPPPPPAPPPPPPTQTCPDGSVILATDACPPPPPPPPPPPEPERG